MTTYRKFFRIQSISVIALTAMILQVSVNCSLNNEENDSFSLLAAAGAALGLSGGEAAGDGDARIAAAGTLPLGDEYRNVTNEVTEDVVPTEIPSSDYYTYKCTTADIDESVIREISDTVALQTGFDSIYPGAVIQGKSLLNGNYTPVTVPRAGGTIFMTGLKLSTGSQYSKKLDTISASSVKQAIEDIIVSENVEGTAAEASYELVQVYSEEHLYFELGVDARYKVTQISGNFSIDTTSRKNYILMKFTQKYYDVIFEDPELSTSVFRDGKNFQDPEGQISEGNPPLYVNKVSFGRQVFFLMESEYDKMDIDAAVSAAYNSGVTEIDVNSKAKYDKVFSKTKINYVVFGGDAGLALAPIAAETSVTMYDAIKDFLANPEAANFSASSPGVPIAYSLRYLKDRTPVLMTYTSTAKMNQCVQTDRAQSISMYFHHIDDMVQIYFKGDVLHEVWAGDSKSWDIKAQVNEVSNYAVFEVQLYNKSSYGSPAGLEMDIHIDGKAAPNCSVNKSTNVAKYGYVYSVIYSVRADGACVFSGEKNNWQ